MILVPAYGKDYKSKEEVLKAWNDGKDFLMKPMDCYCSIRDKVAIKEGGYDSIEFRYSSRKKAFVITLED